MLKKIIPILSLTLFVALFAACAQDAPSPEEETTVVEEVEAVENSLETSGDLEAESAAQAERVVLSDDFNNEAIQALLNQMPLVQHHYNPDTNIESFTCVGNAGLNSVKVNPEGSIYVGPDSGDISLRGVNVVFEIDPSGGIQAAPMGRESKLINKAGEEVFRVPLNEVLTAFTTGDAVWTGTFEDPGRGNCLVSFQG